MTKLTHKYIFKKKIKPSNFSITQYENIATRSHYSNSYNWQPVKNVYTCEFLESDSIDYNKPTILICIKDDIELLKFTLNNLKQNEIFNFANILIIDDRPSNNSIKTTTLENSCSYMKVKNIQNKFNFSMLHNLAVHALQSKTKKLKEIILWNSDLWTDNSKTLPTLYQRHIEDGNTITGTKLLYPTKEFLRYKSDRADKVQFAGSMFGPRPNEVGLFALHMFRGYPKDDPKVNCNKGELFITGAFLIIDSEWYIKSGGFCPTLKASFQDIVLCLRANEQNKRVMYYGKDLHFYHYENYILDNKNSEVKEQQFNDKLWYINFWNPSRIKDLLYINEK